MLTPRSPSVADVDKREKELRSIVEACDPHQLDQVRAAVEANPQWPDLRLALARRYALRGEIDMALGELDAALQRNADFAEALRLKAEILTDRGSLIEALHVLHHLNRVATDDPRGFLAQAALHARLGEHAAAIGAARNALTLDRTLFDAHVLLGEQYLVMEDDRLAIRHFEIAVKLRADQDVSYLLGLLHLRHDDQANAEAQFRRALEANPRHLNSSIRLAMIKIAETDYAQAYNILNEAIVNYPSYPDLHYGLARVCLLMGRWEEAYQLMTAALKLNPNYAEVRREIVSLCGDRADEAADHIRKSLQTDPRDEQAAINLGHLYARQGDHERAIEVLEHAAGRTPGSWRLLQTLGVVNLQKKQFPKAKLAFDSAAQLNPELGAVERSLRIVFKDDSLFESERQVIVDKYDDLAEEPIKNHHLGRLHLDFAKEKMAAQFLRQSLQSGYRPAENKVLLATIAADEGNLLAAIRWLEGMEVTGFANNVRCTLLGLFHANSGEHEVSTRYYQRVMTDAPLFFHSLLSLAVSFREIQEVEDMLNDYRDYVRQNERTGPLCRRIGLAYANMGKLPDARRNFDHATILDQKDGRAFHSLGNLALLRLDLEAAVQLFTHAVECEPDWATPQLSLALTQLEMGEHYSAMLSLQRYIFLEQADCWRELAADLNSRLNEEYPV